YMAGPNDPQFLITPFYLQLSGDGGIEWPASAKSIIARIVDGSRAGDLNAIVLYGDELASSDQMELVWGAWRPDGTSLALQPIGVGSSVRLDPGVFNVVLDIRHRGSPEQILRVQRHVFVRQVLGRDAPSLPSV